MSLVTVKWIDSKMMLGVDSAGQPVVLSTWPERIPSWTGLKPSDLLLLAAASCVMYDVVEILKKQREPLEGLEITCEGEQLTEPPYAYLNIHMNYLVKGDVNRDKLERAIDLAQNKYCSVVSTLRRGVPVTHAYQIQSR